MTGASGLSVVDSSVRAPPSPGGVHREMYRKQLWTMRQYAGYATAAESNARYRYLLDHGQTGMKPNPRA